MSASELIEQANAPTAIAKEREAKRSYPKTHANYWKARKELRAGSPEAYKLFLLCMCAGLRRGEADVCLWSQLRPDDCSIRVEATEFIEPKHGSGGTGYVDPAR